MQDNAQHDQEQHQAPQGQDETYYPVLSVGLGDLESAIAPFAETAEEEDYLTDEERTEQEQRLAFVRNMSPFQWKHLADHMGSILFDGDRWDDALQAALAREMAYAETVPDHQAMQGAA
jgi:hypothetical protein